MIRLAVLLPLLWASFAEAQTTNISPDRSLTATDTPQIAPVNIKSSRILTRLGELFVLDYLFKNKGEGILSPTDDLGNLFILDQLFDPATGISSATLGRVFVLKHLLKSDLLSPDDGVTLGDVIILNQAFKNVPCDSIPITARNLSSGQVQTFPSSCSLSIGWMPASNSTP